MREKKIGHTGTLDPMATGVLVLLLGSATRFLNFLPESDKGYRARFVLGKTTDTLDITGTVLTEKEVTVSEEEVKQALSRFRGVIRQLPPMYSAKSVDGQRLYALARQGIEVDRKPCEVEIKRLDYCGCRNGEYTIEVFCSKGTYIRSLIDDLGRALGCGAVMTALERTDAMGFSLSDCVTLEELQERRDREKGFDDLVIPLEKLFDSYPRVTVSDAQAKRFLNGGSLALERLREAPKAHCPCTVYSPEQAFLGLAENNGEELGILKILPR